MHAEIIKIGNSKGLRIPKTLLEQCELAGKVNLHVKNHALIITSCKNRREGWKEQFQLMAKNGDDVLLDEDVSLSSWDDEDWQW